MNTTPENLETVGRKILPLGSALGTTNLIEPNIIIRRFLGFRIISFYFEEKT